MATYKSPSCKGTAHLLFLKLSVLCSQVVIENCFQKSSYFPSFPALCKAVTELWVHETHDLHVRRRESLFALAAQKLGAAPSCKANSPLSFSSCWYPPQWLPRKIPSVSLQRVSSGFKFLSQVKLQKKSMAIDYWTHQSASLMS